VTASERGDELSPREKALLDDPPPILGTWNRIYVLILVYLVLLIAGFGVFTAVFNR
jgi:hypothetical protein